MCGNDSRAGFICLNIIVNETAKVCVLADEGVTYKGSTVISAHQVDSQQLSNWFPMSLVFRDLPQQFAP
jgi:hypothetical protein